MAERFMVTPPRTADVKALQALTTELNAVLARLGAALAQVQGKDNLSPTFGNDVDLGGYRLTNVGASRADDDAVTRREVANFGMFRRSISDPLTASAPIRATYGITVPPASDPTEPLQLGQVQEVVSTTLGATAAPPEVESIGLTGTATTRFALEDHTHSGVNLSDAQTVGGAKRWSANALFDLDVEVDGALNHDGTTVGFYGTVPVAQAGAYANRTDNSGGTPAAAVSALTDPADTPLTADALRDDLVANLIPELRNNFATLATAVNTALTAHRGVGMLAP